MRDAVGAVLQPESSFQYPPAEASQEEVTNNPELFHATLKKVSGMQTQKPFLQKTFLRGPSLFE